MFLKLFKLLFLAMVTTLVGYYVALADNPNEHKAINSNDKDNSVTKKIAYKRKFNGGILLLTADEVVLRTKEKLVLSEIKASFTKDKKDITIKCGSCVLDLKERKAHLSENVIIKSVNMTCCTASAWVDFMAQTITGKDKVTGTGARGSFISDGFSVDKEGIIKLKKVTVKGKK